MGDRDGGVTHGSAKKQKVVVEEKKDENGTSMLALLTELRVMRGNR